LFDPPLVPPETIPDPTDKKPADWVDQATISDPTDKKPDDWDEDAPRTIDDPDLPKPAEWVDDAPECVINPSAKQPDLWDEKEDGKWEAPLIQNPVCLNPNGGCGPWKHPQMPNPNYKGKWVGRQIPNPAYKGEWKPRPIPNPHFFVPSKIGQLGKISGVAVEVEARDTVAYVTDILMGHSIADLRPGRKRWSERRVTESFLQRKANALKLQQHRARLRTYLEAARTFAEKRMYYKKIAQLWLQEYVFDRFPLPVVILLGFIVVSGLVVGTYGVVVFIQVRVKENKKASMAQARAEEVAASSESAEDSDDPPARQPAAKAAQKKKKAEGDALPAEEKIVKTIVEDDDAPPKSCKSPQRPTSTPTKRTRTASKQGEGAEGSAEGTPQKTPSRKRKSDK
jgi:hypothetical protein